MELTNEEINLLGCEEKYLCENTNLRKVASTGDYVFTCAAYTFEIKNGYKRSIVGYNVKAECIEFGSISKSSFSVGFYPTYAGKEAIFKNFTSRYRDNHIQTVEDEIGQFVEVIIQGYDLIIKSKDPSKYLIEFNFGCHSFGPDISILTREGI